MTTPAKKNDAKQKGGTPESTPAGGGNGAAGKPRRLGRGLSGMIGAPVVVSSTPPRSSAQAPASQAPAHETPAPARRAEPMVELKPALAAEPVASVKTVAAEVEPGGVGERLIEVDVSLLEPSRYQPRKKFDEAALAELAASITSAGIVQPIVVRPMSDGKGERYEIIAGERRWRAARLAGLRTVPARVCDVGEAQAAEWALIENLQRADLGPMERAWALRGLCEKFGLTHAQAGQRVGLDRSSVSNLVRLTELENEISEYLENGLLSLGHGKALLGMVAGPARISLAKKATQESWSVRRLESESAKMSQTIANGAAGLAKGVGAVAEGGPRQDPRAASLLELEQQLSSHMGTRVRLRTSRDGARGRLVLEFYDLDHFDGLMSKMGFVLRS